MLNSIVYIRDGDMTVLFKQLLIDDGSRNMANTISWCQPEIINFSTDLLNDGKCLSALVFRVLKRPKNLFAHMQRIYFCYQKKWPEQLFAALLDLLVTLAGRGQDLAISLVYGSRSVISREQLAILKNYLLHPSAVESAQHRYSVLALGLLGSVDLLSYQQQSHAERDFLVLANDYIEYSQLGEAMAILETGINLQPERSDIQQLLLELYKSTHNQDRFTAMYKILIERNASLIEGWHTLKKFFDASAA